MEHPNALCALNSYRSNTRIFAHNLRHSCMHPEPEIQVSKTGIVGVRIVLKTPDFINV